MVGRFSVCSFGIVGLLRLLSCVMSSSDSSDPEVIEVRCPNRSCARDVLKATRSSPSAREYHPAFYNGVDYRQLAIDDGFIFPTNGWYPRSGNCPKCFKIGSFAAGNTFFSDGCV